MPVLIDGHNLIAKLPGIHLDDPDDEERLVERLRRYQARTGKRFSRLSEETFERYREDWKEALAEIRAETDAFFVDLRQRSGKGS